MREKSQMKVSGRVILRGLLALVLVFALCASSIVTVTANTVSANVIDGDHTYSFRMSSSKLEDLLSEAEKLGLAPLGKLDRAERVQSTTTVYVRRGVILTLDEAGQRTDLVAYAGETVEEALRENNILLRDMDEVSPARTEKITRDLKVTVRRACTVSVIADGEVHQVSLSGATVKDALAAAGVTLQKEDSLNFPLSEPLFEKMNIRVARVVKIKVTVDGKTKEYEIAAQSVKEALERCGVVLGEDDRISCRETDRLTDGMHITVFRVTKKELLVKEEAPFETIYEDTDELEAGETEVKVVGVPGEKEVLYEVIFVDGKEEGKVAVEETILTEPVDEVILRGTQELQEDEGYEPGDSVDSSSAGTFVDHEGNVVSYSRLLTGDCTAYSVPGGTTSLGWKAEYGIIAVNPNVIPYGTRMYVTSPDGSVVYGYGIAGDTGGACMAGTIIADLCYNTIEECSIIGRRTMNVYILS